MKMFGVFALLLSVCMLTVGCGEMKKAETKPEGETTAPVADDAHDEAAHDEASGDEAAADNAPAEEAPAEEAAK